MLDIVDNCLDKNELHLIEAPTWIWKTFAYLVPSIIYSIKNWEQVFVSTTTKALQDQIYYKDLEFLKNNLWFEFSYSKLKWKRNYFW
jgi:Rad3-related DNA helicase